MKNTSLAALTILAFTTSVHAGGPISVGAEPVPEVAPASAAVRDWSGPYVGLSYGRVSGDIDDSFGVYDYESGSAVGGFFGYNLQRNQLVYGGELLYSSVSDVTVVGGGGDDSLDSLLELRGRLGYAVGNALIYGALGYSRGEMTINGTDNPTVSGTSYGLGVDLLVTQKVFVGLDYTSRNLSGTNDNPGNTFDIDTTVNTVSLRVGLSF